MFTEKKYTTQIPRLGHSDREKALRRKRRANAARLAEINGYKAGVEYNYCISIASIEEIFLRTSIREWDSTSGEAQLGNQVITFE